MNDSTDHWKKIQFVIAIMTRNYVRATEIGRSILIKEPNNTCIREYLTIIEKIDIDTESKCCTDTDNEDTDIIKVVDKGEKKSNSNNLTQTHSKKLLSFKIDRPFDDNNYSSPGSPYKIDGKMYRVLPIKFYRKVD